MIPEMPEEQCDYYEDAFNVQHWLEHGNDGAKKIARRVIDNLPKANIDAWETFSCDYFIRENVDNADIRLLPDSSLFDAESGCAWFSLKHLRWAVEEYISEDAPPSWFIEDDDSDSRAEWDREQRSED